MKILSQMHFIREFFRVTWYSVSSQKFYPDIYTKYKGFGVKYIATIISFTSLIYLLVSYSGLLIQKNSLENEKGRDSDIEFIISQWPEITYKDGQIAWAEEEPLLITNKNGKTIIAIDPESKLTASQESRIPIIFKSRRILLSVTKNNENKTARAKDMSVGYEKIFGKEDLIINSEVLREQIISTIDSISIFMLIMFLPIFILVRLFLHIFGSLLYIILFFLVFLFMGMKPSIKSIIRVVLFASGAAEIAAVILFLIIPQMMSLASMVEYWAIILAAYSITKYCGQKKIKKL